MSALLKGTYFPRHEENRMHHEGDVEAARTFFLSRRFRNLEFLLNQRYGWMNAYLKNRSQILELGAGAGFSREFIHHPGLKLSDVVARPWVDEVVDALNIPHADGSLDALICSHMIHHLAHPAAFFEQLRSKLKPGGIIIIHDLNTSLALKILLRLMRHEGWSYAIDVFDRLATANDPTDPWSANCAIPELLFQDHKAFAHRFPGLTIIHHQYCECLLFPLSGGVISKTPVPELPLWLLRLVNQLDGLLVRAAPKIFAMSMQVVIARH